jgi:hypothetical protein
VPAIAEPTQTDLRASRLYSLQSGSTTFDYDNVPGIAIIPPDTATGTYTLQWVWTDQQNTNWYSCAEIQVEAINVSIQSLSSGVPVTSNAVPLEMHYYKLYVDMNQHVYITVAGPASGALVVSVLKGTFPTASLYNEQYIVASSTQSANSVCSDSDSAATVYIGIQHEQVTSGTYTVSAQAYASWLDYRQAVPQITDSVPNGGSKYYWTEAYSTFDVPKRVAVDKLSGIAPISLERTENCNERTIPQPKIGDDSACVDLPDEAGRSYFRVASTDGSPIDYEMYLEAGTCNERSFGSQIHISFALLLVAVLFALI